MRIEDGAQDLIDRLLTHAVGHSGDTERAHLFRVRSLRDVDATNRQRLVAVFHELALKLSQVGFDVLFVGANRHPVETMDTFIGSDPTPCGPEVVPTVNLVDKRMGFEHRFPLACYTFATRLRVRGLGRRFIEPITNWFFVGGHRLRKLLGVRGGIPSLA